MCVYTHRQLLVSTLIREVSLSSEQWWTWIHGCTKHREKVMGKGSALNKSIYMKHSKPQGTLQKRGQKNVRSKTGRREKGRWTRQGPCNLSRTPHPAPMQHLICIRTGLSMVKCGCRQSLGGLKPHCWNIWTNRFQMRENHCLQHVLTDDPPRFQ